MSQISVLYLKPVASAWPGSDPPMLNEMAISPSELYSKAGYTVCIPTQKAVERAGQNKTLVFSYLMFSLQMKIITDFEIWNWAWPPLNQKLKF